MLRSYFSTYSLSSPHAVTCTTVVHSAAVAHATSFAGTELSLSVHVEAALSKMFPPDATFAAILRLKFGCNKSFIMRIPITDGLVSLRCTHV